MSLTLAESRIRQTPGPSSAARRPCGVAIASTARRTAAGFLALVATALADGSHAQPSADRLEQRFERPREPLSQPGRIIPELDPLSAPGAADEFTFRLGAVHVIGNTVIDDDELRPVYEEWIGAEVTIGEVFAIANRMTALYGERGYPLTRAIVPAQEIDASGAVEVRIVEGFVNQVTIGGAAEPNPVLQHYARRLEAERPIRGRTLERSLLLADDLPGISVRAVLRRSQDAPGGTDVVLQVEEDRPFSGFITVDNRGSRAVGRVQLDATGVFDNLLHPNSRTTVRLVNASANDELVFATAEHLGVLGGAGTTWRAALKVSRSAPGTASLTAIELESRSSTGLVELRHPVLRSRPLNLEAYGALEARNARTRVLGAALHRDRIRSLRLGMDFDRADEAGGLDTVSLELSQGLHGLGASSDDDRRPPRSREHGRTDYAKAVLEASRTQALGVFTPGLSRWSIYASVMGQLTGDALLSSEQCSVGGARYGGAFDSGILAGDRCHAVRTEVRYRPADAGALDSLEFHGFVDAGQVSNLDAGAGSPSLASAGAGLRLGFLGRYSASVEVAKPLHGPGADDESPRIFLSLTGKF